jgi:diacylglycerol kinase (ATP)
MKTQRKIVYLINPISGTKGKEETKKLIEQLTAERNIPFEILPTNKEGNYESLKSKIVRDQITDIVICGGDGSVNTVTNGLLGADVNIGIIPMGSGNGLATAAGISKNPKKALEVVFDGYNEAVDTFRMNDQYSCMLTGLGFDAKVAHDFAQQKTRGLMTYVKQTISNFFSSPFYQFEIKVDDFTFYTDAFFICIANANQFGNNFTIAPQASLSDGLLDIVIVQKMNKAKMPFAILRQIRGNNKLQKLVHDMQHRSVFYFQTPQLELINHKMAPMHIDGEPRETAGSFKIQVMPKTYRLLMKQK